MSALSLASPFPIFTDIDGNPLEEGYIYVGTAGLNPETNPIQAYWDAALTVPAAQPIRTLGGYPSRSGAAARIYASADDCSLLVKNKNGSLIFSALNQTERLSSDLVTFIQDGAGAVSRSAQGKMREWVAVKDFGAVGDGVTNDYAAVLAANTFADGRPLLFDGVFHISAALDITSPIVDTQAQIFSATSNVTLSNVEFVRPEWWGAVAVPSQNSSSILQAPNDCTAAILKAIASIRYNWQPSGRVVLFQIGVYGVSSIQLSNAVLYSQGLTLRGSRSTHKSGASAINVGNGGASVLQSISASTYLLQLNGALGGPTSELHFEDISFDGRCEKDAVIEMAPGSGGPSETVNYIYFDRCVWHNVKDTKWFVSSNTNNVHSENALVYFNQCAFQLNSPLQGANTGISIFLQNPGAWQWQFHQCYFSGTALTNYATVYVATGGVELSNCYFEANTGYDIGCLDGGWIHAHDCHSDSTRVAFFGTYPGGATYTSSRGVIIENLIWKQGTETWAIISDSIKNITIRNIFGGGVYLRSGSGNAFIENVVGGNVEFGNRSDAANTYTGTATLVNVPNINTSGVAVATAIGAVNVIEGTDSATLQQFVATDLLHYLRVLHVAGTEAYYLVSYKHGVGYKKLYIRASEVIFDAGELRLSNPGQGVILRTPDDTKSYRISVNNAGAVVATLV